MAIQATVTFENAVPSTRPDYDLNVITALVKAAVYYINSFVQGTGSIDLLIRFDDTILTANGGSLALARVGTLNGRTLYAQGAEAEWRGGGDQNGTTADGRITIGGAAAANYFFFDTTLATANDIAAGKRDFFSSMVHEILHVIGFNGPGDDGTYYTTYSAYLSGSGASTFFTGVNAVTAFGGPVPVDPENNHAHLGGSPPTSNPAPLVGGFIDTLTAAGARDHFTATELGVLTDLGYTVTGTQNRITGTTGIDVVAAGGPAANYLVEHTLDLTWLLDRTGVSYAKPVDANVEWLQFTDRMKPGTATLTVLNAAFAQILRIDPTSTAATQGTIALADGTSVANPVRAQALSLATLAAQVDSGQMTLAGALAQVAHYADTTTSVAMLAYQFFTGVTPRAAGVDFLVAGDTNANDLNDAYYVKFNIENRYINFASNLGKVGEGAARFQADYGSLDIYGAVRAAYAKIFGIDPDAAKVSSIVDTQLVLNGVTLTRGQYFASYGLDGLNGQGTKAAAVGWLLAEAVKAVKADIGSYARAEDHFLVDLVDGNAQFNVDLTGVYAPVIQNGAVIVGLAPTTTGFDLFSL